jgi:flagellar protein FliS
VNAVETRYLTERVTTASPAELTEMLFDAAVGAIKAAQRLTAEGHRPLALPKVLKAQNIVLELRATLNHEAGPLATNLDALYTWAYTRLLDVVAKQDPRGLADALDVLAPIQDAWKSACLPVAA